MSAPTLGPITNVGIMADRVLYRVVVTYPGEKSKDVDFNGPANSEGVGPVVMISGYSQILIYDPSRFGPFGPEWIRRFFA